MLLLLIHLALAQELLVTFDYYALPQTLLDALHQPPSRTFFRDDTALTDFVVVEASLVQCEAIAAVGHVKGCYEHKKLNRKPLMFDNSDSSSPASIVGAKAFWKKGFKGKGVKVGIFDSGVSGLEVTECINFTNEADCSDASGHGTFVTSVFTSTEPSCPGVAPEAEVYMFKVFTATQESYTAWFLQAFNHARSLGVKVFNLSTGGIDYLDAPFVQKIQELVEAGAIVVSAVGNDGPGLGTINNPSDQPEVIAVGALDSSGKSVADFSSRGPTTWELSSGMGRVKPDVVTYGQHVLGFSQGKCRTSSGSSVATPVLAASLALIVKPEHTPGQVKAAVLSSASSLKKSNLFAQGAGAFNLTSTAAYLAAEATDLTIFPASWNLSDSLMSPYDLQPL
jgi:membrane-bound transcription factor site-1 protease